MNKGDVVTVKTGCHDCGDVPALVHDTCHDRAYVEIIGELPHSLKDKPNARWLWIDIKKLTFKDIDREYIDHLRQIYSGFQGKK